MPIRQGNYGFILITEGAFGFFCQGNPIFALALHNSLNVHFAARANAPGHRQGFWPSVRFQRPSMRCRSDVYSNT